MLPLKLRGLANRGADLQWSLTKQRALAGKTSDATEQIGTTIAQINQEVKLAAGNSSNLIKVIDEGVSMTRELNDHLTEINKRADNIQHAVNALVENMNDNTGHIQHISGIIGQTSAHYQETENEVASIADKSSGLSESAEPFSNLSVVVI